MEHSFLCNTASAVHSLQETITSRKGHSVTSISSFPFPINPKLEPIVLFPILSSPSSFTMKCRNRLREEPPPISSAYSVLGVDPNCSSSELKAAFRAKVKEFHPDVRKDGIDSDTVIRRVIEAYQMLSNLSRECLDPFDYPECEASDVFVNESLCAGKGTVRAASQGFGEDYQVQLAVGQCPRSCIHYVTPSQRVILEELLDSILNTPYDTTAEADLLYSLIAKAKFENNRYQKPKKQPKASTQHVDWR